MFLIFECNNVFEIISDKARTNLLQTHIWPISLLYLPPIVLILKSKGWLVVGVRIGFEIRSSYWPGLALSFSQLRLQCLRTCAHALKPRHQPGTGLT